MAAREQRWWRREGAALGAALVLHGLVLLAIRHAPHESAATLAAPQRVPAATPKEVELDLQSFGAAAPRAADGVTRVEPPAERHQPRAAAGERTTGELDSGATSDSVPPGEIGPSGREFVESSGSGSDAGVLDVHREAPAPRAPIDLGIGADGWQRWVARDDAPGTTAEPPRANRYQVFRAPPASTTGGVQEGLEARTRALGLGPNGRVKSAFHAAAHRPDAPELGRASFQVTVLQSGDVEIGLASSTEPAERWSSVAAHAAAELRRKPPRIPPGRRGVRLVIDVVAEEVMPNGSRVAELHGPRLEAKLPAIRSARAAQAEIEDLNPTAGGPAQPSNVPLTESPVVVELPGVFIAHKGKVCSYAVGITPLGIGLTGGCDPSHSSVKPQRRVSTATRGEVMF